MKKITVKIQKDENGELFSILPMEVCEAIGYEGKEDEPLVFERRPDCWLIRKPKVPDK